MNQPNELINLINQDTGDRVRTTRKVLDSYYSHQGYVEEADLADEEEGRAPFLEVSPPKIASNRQPLRGAAKASANKKAAK